MIKGFCNKGFFFVFVVVLTVFPVHSSKAQLFGKKTGKSEFKPIVIKSHTLEWDNAKETVTFSGEVNAEMEDFVVDCPKMQIIYKSTSDQKSSDSVEAKIEKIVASGGVKITRSEGGTATAERAIFYQMDEKLVLEGNPSVKQGRDLLEGDRITIFLKENRSLVEGSKEKKVKAIIFPRSKER